MFFTPAQAGRSRVRFFFAWRDDKLAGESNYVALASLRASSNGPTRQMPEPSLGMDRLLIALCPHPKHCAGTLGR